MTHTIALPPGFGLAVTAVVCGGALWKGGPEERNAAGAILFAILVTIGFRDHSWSGLQWGAIAADLMLLAVFVAIALRTARWWPLFAAAFQLLSVVSHLARVADPTLNSWTYATANVIWTQLVLWTTGVGAFNAWRAGRQPAISAPPGTAGATRR